MSVKAQRSTWRPLPLVRHDLIPDVVPFFGVVDDLLLVPLAIRWLLKRLPPDIAEAAARSRAHATGR